MQNAEDARAGLMSWTEIARITGWSINTVQRDYENALRKLRLALAEEGITDDEFVAYLELRTTQWT